MRTLPQWFGLEQSLVDYAQGARTLPTLLAREGSRDVGFLTLKPQTAAAFEISRDGRYSGQAALRNW